MKKNKQKADTKQNSVPQFGRLTLLVGALIATGVLSPLSLPEAAAAPLLPVPVGLPCGGCATVAGMPSSFVQMGSVTTNLDPATGLPIGGGTNLTVNQSSQVAILNWQNFNIAKGYNVNFVQLNSTSSALNRIWDANPTTIAGSLTANGQLYLINHNGIIFANGAQVNTSALIASSLDITDSAYQKGYLANNNVNGVLTPTFSGNSGFIRVDTGASLNGSRIMLFAPVVENNGKIVSADGQVVLAAGTAVYLEASQDPNLRGVLVEVDLNKLDANGKPILDVNGKPISVAGQAVPIATDPNTGKAYVQNVAGTVTNTNNGSILSQRGNTTLIGYAVNQQGLVSATTSVTENGSIKLLARYSVDLNQQTTANKNMLANDSSIVNYDIRATKTGAVTLAKNSITQVTPETNDASTTTDGQGFNPSIVEVMGKTVNVQGSIIAPGAKVNLVAVGSIDTSVGSIGQSGYGIYQEIDPTLAYSSFLNPNYKPVAAADGARVFLDNGSLIDVSGSTASVSVARNILAVQLRGSQLADAPLQKNGFLWGKTVAIDIRTGSTLANYSGDEAQIGRTVAERTSAGGNVVIASSGDAVMNPNATINISGGQVKYDGANINTTTLISNGVIYDIAKASPNQIYNGISGTYTQTSNKWGITQTFSTMAGGDIRGRWDPGYVEGKAAGSVTFLVPNAAIEGKIIANTVSGINQRQPYVDPTSLAVNNYMNTWQMQAKGGSLSIGFNGPGAQDATTKLYNFLTNTDVVVQTNAQQTNYSVADALTPNAPITLDANLFSSGLNNLAVYTNGISKIAAGTALTLAPGGSLALQSGQVDMLGSINIADGSVSLKTVQTVNPAYNLVAGAVTVGGNISTRGTWVNDSTFFGVPNTSKVIVKDGGSISISAGNVLNIASGLTFDASAGGWVDQAGKVHGGNGGNISLSSAIFQAALDKITLNSFGVDTGKGGSLKLGTGNGDVQIGGVAPNGTRSLAAAFFQSGGFSSYTISAGGTLNVDGIIRPKTQTLILNRNAVFKATGSDVYALSNRGFLPDWQRNPANITLNATNLSIGANAEILTDPKGSITLNAANQLSVFGTLAAPAGTINLSLATAPTYLPTQSIWLGSGSKLLAQGYFQQAQPNKQNLTQGQVLAGGKINISANAGYVVAQKGSLMDVSGTSASIDLPQLQSGSLIYHSNHVAGDAGSINAQTSLGAIFDGSMKAGVEAGSQAAAGSFSLTLNNDPELASPTTNPGLYPMVPPQIQVTAGGNGAFAIQAGIAVNDASAGLVSLNAIAGKALLDASALQKSGFDQVKLKSDNSIMLGDQVDLQARRSVMLDSPELVVNGNSKITSTLVTLGNFEPKLQGTPSPVAGIGALNVAAQQVDLTGNLTVSGVKQLNIVSSGDIRLNGVANSTYTALMGSLRTQGNVSLQADQVYSSTLAQYKLSVENGSGNPAGNITIFPGQHSSHPVMSAGSQLTLSAADIVQNGVLKAPMGTLNLNGSNSVMLGSGSLTSVSADGLTIPFGLIQGGNTWMYDVTGAGTLVSVSVPPQKIVKLGGPNVTVAKGATVDLSGGGDLYANEFFAGSGGSVNVLDPTKAPANTFAIIPGLSGYAPYDPQAAGQYTQAGSKTTLQPGASVYLGGGNGLAAGYYTLLPASYALLPGAYRVTAVSGYTDLQPGQGAVTLVNGSQIMAGKFAVVGTNIQDARYSGFQVTPGNVVRTQAEYHDSYANAFFAAQAATSGSIAPRSPIDAGQLIVDATGALQLVGTFKTQPGTGGKGAWIDLNGPNFDIVNVAGTGAAGFVELTTSTLNNLGAESLLIGGVRTQTATGTSIAVGANSVVVDNSGATLSGAEIMLAANDAVTVKAGSSIQGNGTFSGKAQNITVGKDQVTDSKGVVTQQAVSGDGALLRVSSSDQVTVTRTNSSGVTGTLTVENGATVSAQNSVLFDASHVTSLGGNATLTGKALSVAANAIDIGNGLSGTTSLGLTPALLAQMQNFRDITLHSYNDINFYGDATLGGQSTPSTHLISNLTLNAKSLNGVNTAANNTASIDAASVTFMNNNGAVVTAPTGSGTLNISADKIVLAGGAKTIQGFDNVALDAAQQITGQGTGSLTLASANTSTHKLELKGTLTGTAKSNQTITAVDAINSAGIITAAGYDTTILATKPSAANGDVGAKLAITAKSILDKGSIDLAAGSVSLHATGKTATDGITLVSTSLTSAAGSTKSIAGQVAYAPAGSITLVSDNGNLDVKSGAVVDVSGAAGGGDAGSLNMTATKGVATVAGNLKGAAATGSAQGSYILDAASLGGAGNALTGLNDTLTAGGFTNLRDIRVRTGNLTIDADVPGSVRAKAQTFRLAADTGNIDVYGTVDATGTNGGSILLAAKNDLKLRTGAFLDAHATDTVAGKGGKVTLETSETRTAAGVQTAAGKIDLGNQLIDVHGSGNMGGSVHLRAPRIAVAGSLTDNEVAINNTGGAALNVSAGANVTVEAFKTYESATGTLSATDVAPTNTNLYYNDAATFAANAAAIKTRLGMLLTDPNMHVTPGVEIDSVVSATNTTGNLTLTSDWDLSAWRFNNGTGALTEAGMLTLRAAGDLIFGSAPTTDAKGNPVYHTASLSDGFSITPATSTTPPNYFTLLPVGSSSWSYRLVAGADATGANILAVNDKKTGNVKLAEGGYTPAAIKCGFGSNASICKNPVVISPAKTSFEMVRTGTGSIDLAAGGGLYLGNNSSMIYTAGQQAILPAILANNLTNKAVFTTGGGDINIAVQADISAVGKDGTGAAVNQLIADWLSRQGSVTSTNGTYATPPAWWVNFGSFAQNIGALGGGNLNISAGGNITSLSAVVPSTGYVAAPGKAAMLMTGGNLSVTAGGNIDSGIFYVGNGQGTISAAGSMGTSRNNTSTNVTLYTILALGQGNIDVRTGGDLNLQTVLNPTMVGLGPMFFTYGDNSAVSLESLNGNVLLSNDTGFYAATPTFITNLATSPYINPGLAKPGALTVYPGTLSVTALNGNITNNINSSGWMTLFPSPKGNLQLLAGADINFNGFLTMSDVSTSGLQANTPVSTYSDNVSFGHGVATGTQLPLHSGDTAPIIIAAGGNITGDNSSPALPSLTLPKSANIQAGIDIKNLSMSVQNVQSSDTTSMTAGRDIVFTPNPSSTSDNPIKTVGVTISGPGQLVVQAGRNVDLGDSPGLVSNGNLSNTYLPAQGAGITVLAGVGQGATATQSFIDKYIQSFIDKYIDPNAPKTYGSDLVAYVVDNWTDLVRHGQASGLKAPTDMTGAQAFAYFGKLSQPLQNAFAGKTYDQELVAYVSNYGGSQNMTPEQAYSYFSTLSKPLQESFVRQVFFSELRNSGRYGLTTKNFQTGFDVISALFPSTGYKGDINLYYSQIKTLRGGNINMLTPGGGVNAGLALGSTKKASELGIVTVDGGDVNAFVNNDFTVNQSRVFTLQGGNILMWSSYGNIDAGKGSKTVSSTPPPQLVVDPKTGTFNVDVTQSVVGSGIRVLLASKNVVPGSVDLYAPAGEINAGDAGIGAAGNIFLGALVVRGADNINFGGTSAGVPVAAPAPVSVGMNLQDASKAADQATQSIASMNGMNANDFKPTFLSIEVIGLGDGSNP